MHAPTKFPQQKSALPTKVWPTRARSLDYRSIVHVARLAASDPVTNSDHEDRAGKTVLTIPLNILFGLFPPFLSLSSARRSKDHHPISHEGISPCVVTSHRGLGLSIFCQAGGRGRCHVNASSSLDMLPASLHFDASLTATRERRRELNCFSGNSAFPLIFFGLFSATYLCPESETKIGSGLRYLRSAAPSPPPLSHTPGIVPAKQPAAEITGQH